MSFRIIGLSPDPFKHLFGLNDAALARHGAIRYTATQSPGFPDRIGMRDVGVGESVLLLNHISQPAETPYFARHAIYIAEGAANIYDKVDEIPIVMAHRVLSFRGFDAAGMMIEGGIAEGEVDQRQMITTFFANTEVAYIHAHNAGRGCYSGRIERV